MDDSEVMRIALKEAISRLKTQTALARLVGVAQPSVSDWVRRMGRLPAEHVLKVEQATGVSRHDLRPDIYPRDDAAPSVSTPGPTHHPRSFGSYPGKVPAAAPIPAAAGTDLASGERP